jgi:hypothetical protein
MKPLSFPIPISVFHPPPRALQGFSPILGQKSIGRPSSPAIPISKLFNPEKAEKNHIFIILSHNMYNLLDIF